VGGEGVEVEWREEGRRRKERQAWMRAWEEVMRGEEEEGEKGGGLSGRGRGWCSCCCCWLRRRPKAVGKEEEDRGAK